MIFKNLASISQACLGKLSRSVLYYLLLTAGLVPLLPPPALLEPLEPEKNLVTSSETSGSSGLGLSMFMDCSISCKDSSGVKTSKQ